MLRQSLEYVGQPGAWIDVIELAGLDQRVHRRGAMAAGSGPGEGPVASPEGQRPDGAFGGIVGRADAAVMEEAG